MKHFSHNKYIMKSIFENISEISKSTKKRACMSDGNTGAYKPLAEDKKGKKNLKKSKYTKDYEKYFEDYIETEEYKMIETNINSIKNMSSEIMEILPKRNEFPEWGQENIAIAKEKIQSIYDVLVKKRINEQDISDGKKKIDSEKIEKALKNKEKETGIPIEALRLIMRRGMAAWRSSHRPGVGQEQWGYARINSFATGGKTRFTADKDLWDQLSDSLKKKLPGDDPNKKGSEPK